MKPRPRSAHLFLPFSLILSVLAIVVTPAQATAPTAVVEYLASGYTAGATTWANTGSTGAPGNGTAPTGGMTKNASPAAVVFAGRESSNSDRVTGTIGNTSTTDFVSIEMWLYMDDSGSEQYASGSMLFSWSEPGSFNYNVYHYKDTVGFNTFNSEVYGINAATLKGGWHHFVFVMNDNTSSASGQKIYVDGIKMDLTCRVGTCRDITSERVFNTSGNFLLMDNDKASDTWNAKGKLGEARIYNSEVSLADAVAKYDATKATYQTSNLPPTVTLAASAATSTSTAISFTVTGNEDINCTTLSTTSGTDFTLTDISAITSIVQTSARVCTVNATSTATSGGGPKVSTLTAAGTFSITDTETPGNAQTTLIGSPQSTTVTISSSDTTAPTVSSVSSSTTNGSYKATSAISIQVNFNEAVTVTGTPQLTLETGTTDRTVNYASGSGTTALTFTYTVQAGDTSNDLDYVATTSLSLNSGTIRDAAANNATLTLASPGAANSLGANKAIVIDTTAPTVTLAASPSTSTSTTISFTVTGSEAITCSTLSTSSGTDFTLTNISAITSIAQTSGTVCTISATSTASADDVPVSSTLTAAAGFSVTDTAGNAQTTLVGSPQTVVVTVASPTTTTTTAPAPPAPAPTTTVPATTTTTTTIARTRTLGITGAAASYSVLMIGPSLLATPSSGGGIVSWTSETPDICSALAITGLSAQSASNTVFRVGYLNSAGTCTITASIAATETHDAATASVSFAVTKLIARVGIKVGGKINNTPLRAASTWSSVTGETISFWATVSMPFGTPKLVTEANNDVQFINLTPTVCSLSEPTKEPFGMRSYATFRTSGVCEIDLLLPTNAQRTRAVPTSTAKATLLATTRTLWFTDSDTASSIAPTDFDGKSFTAQVSAGASEGQISYASATTDVCTIDRLSGLLRVIKSGTCTLYASVPATVNFASASAAPLSFEVAFEKTVASTTTLAPKKSSPLTTIMPPSSLAKLTPTTIPNVKVQVDTQIILNDDVTEFVVTRDSLISIARNLKLTSGTVRIRTSNGLWTSQNLNEVADIRLPFNPATTALELEFISDGGEPIKFTVPLSMKQNSRLVVNLAAAFGAIGVLWFFIFMLRRRKRDETLPPPPALS